MKKKRYQQGHFLTFHELNQNVVLSDKQSKTRKKDNQLTIILRKAANHHIREAA